MHITQSIQCPQLIPLPIKSPSRKIWIFLSQRQRFKRWDTIFIFCTCVAHLVCVSTVFPSPAQVGSCTQNTVSKVGIGALQAMWKNSNVAELFILCIVQSTVHERIRRLVYNPSVVVSLQSAIMVLQCDEVRTTKGGVPPLKVDSANCKPTYHAPPYGFRWWSKSKEIHHKRPNKFTVWYVISSTNWFLCHSHSLPFFYH